MQANHGIADDDYVPGSSGEPVRRLRFVVAATGLLMLIAFLASETGPTNDGVDVPDGGRRMPATEQVLEPDRPDLIGEPRLQDPR